MEALFAYYALILYNVWVIVCVFMCVCVCVCVGLIVCDVGTLKEATSGGAGLLRLKANAFAR